MSQMATTMDGSPVSTSQAAQDAIRFDWWCHCWPNCESFGQAMGYTVQSGSTYWNAPVARRSLATPFSVSPAGTKRRYSSVAATYFFSS